MKNLNTAILINKRKINHLSSAVDLLNFQIKPGDLYIVESHGEIIPFVAMAIKQGILGIKNDLFLHIDAHFDDKLETKSHNSKNTQTLISNFLNSDLGCKKESFAFEKLCKYTNKDIETFIATISHYFDEIATFIRPEDCNQTYFYPPMPFDTYLRQNNQERINFPINPKLAVNKLKNKEINLISIDADYFACLRENNEINNFEKMSQRSKDIIEALHKLKIDKRLNNCLYTISIDKNWCKYPEEVVNFFLKNLSKISNLDNF